MKNFTKILDCTLRDGGYYNNWNFDKEFVEKYLEVMSLLNIDMVEMGFRTIKNNDFCGPNKFTTDEYLKSLKIPRKIKICVMINASEFNEEKMSQQLKTIFNKAKKSKVSLIRIASHLDEMNKSIKISNWLRKMGYKVAINLMQISEYSEKEIIKFTSALKKQKPDIIYFADSLGSVRNNHVKKIVLLIKKHWDKDIGIHAHNNLGLGIINTIEAVKNGANWADSTLAGMGRGPGNAQTEYLIFELGKISKFKKSILSLLKFLNSKMNELKKKYEWGTNIFYYLSGINGIHPTYIQTMLSNNFSDKEILDNIEKLKKIISNKYDKNFLSPNFDKKIFFNEGTWSPNKFLKNKNILIIANGPSVKKFKNNIENFIKEKRLVVFSLNTNLSLEKKMINYYIACHPFRLLSELSKYKNLNSPIILPKKLLEKIKYNKKNINILNYGVGIEKNNFVFKKNGAVIPGLYAFAYALGIANSAGAKNILLAGFDGYEDQTNNQQTNYILDVYKSLKKKIKLVSITPTKYNIASKSLYSEEIRNLK